jgi:hypothetical protein
MNKTTKTTKSVRPEITYKLIREFSKEEKMRMGIRGVREPKNLLILFAIPRVKIIKAMLDMPTGEHQYLERCQSIYTAFFGNVSGFFTTAFDMLATLALNNAALDKALTDISNNVDGAEAAKLTALDDLRITLILALAYVNKLALLNQRQAVEIIEAAHMVVVGRGKFNQLPIEVKIGLAPGEIIARCMIPKEDGKKIQVVYFTECSSDKGVTWVPQDPSFPAIITISGLASNVPLIVRFRTWTKNGWSEWFVSSSVTPT